MRWISALLCRRIRPLGSFNIHLRRFWWDGGFDVIHKRMVGLHTVVTHVVRWGRWVEGVLCFVRCGVMYWCRPLNGLRYILEVQTDFWYTGCCHTHSTLLGQLHFVWMNYITDGGWVRILIYIHNSFFNRYYKLSQFRVSSIFWRCLLKWNVF